MAYQSYDRRVVIYPTYIDQKKTQSEGRKISAEKGCENPMTTEIFDVVKFLKLPCEIEMNKSYSREWWIQGRVRVQLKDESGKPINEEIPTRKALFLEVARLVPRHPNRQNKAKEKDPKQAAASTSAKGTKHQGGKKGGKKGRR